MHCRSSTRVTQASGSVELHCRLTISRLFNIHPFLCIPVQHKKQSGIQIAEVDVDYDAQYVPQYNVKNIPTMILLENGQEVRRSVGYKDMNQVNSFING